MGLLWYVHPCVCANPLKCHCNRKPYLQGLVDMLASNKALAHCSEVIREMLIKISDTLPCVQNLRTRQTGRLQIHYYEKVCIKTLHHFKLYESETMFWCYLTYVGNISIPCFDIRAMPLRQKSTAHVISMESDTTSHRENWGRSSRSLSDLSFIRSGEWSPLWLSSPGLFNCSMMSISRECMFFFRL